MSRAFTLIETLVTLGLLSMLIAAMFVSIGHVADRREQLSVWSDSADGIDLFFSKLESATRSTFVRSESPGIRGSVESLRIAWHEEASDVLVELWFEIGVHAEGGLIARTEQGEERFGKNISRVRFRFLTGGRWVERFDSAESNALPSAIEIALWTDERETPSRVRVFGILEGQSR